VPRRVLGRHERLARVVPAACAPAASRAPAPLRAARSSLRSTLKPLTDTGAVCRHWGHWWAVERTVEVQPEGGGHVRALLAQREEQLRREGVQVLRPQPCRAAQPVTGAPGPRRAGRACFRRRSFGRGCFGRRALRAQEANLGRRPRGRRRRTRCLRGGTRAPAAGRAARRSGAEPPPSPCTNWTRLVLPPVLSGHVSSFPPYAARSPRRARAAKTPRAVGARAEAEAGAGAWAWRA